MAEGIILKLVGGDGVRGVRGVSGEEWGGVGRSGEGRFGWAGRGKRRCSFRVGGNVRGMESNFKGEGKRGEE